MNKNLQSPTTLTEFAPLSPEPDDSPGISYLISKLFKRSSSTADTKQSTTTPTEPVSTPDVSQDLIWPDNPQSKEPQSDVNSLSGGETYRLDGGEGRSLPNVLKRISNLLALKSTGLQSYKDTELKQYWMPDSVSKECYDCGEKFTTFRRKHHCRVCGQIFCSRCCNQEIPGKIMGCTGDLRVCTYCGKVVLSYLQSADMGADLSSDLRALQEDLQTKFGGLETSPLPTMPASSQPSSMAAPSVERDESVKRKPSVGYQEEKFIQARSQGQVLLEPPEYLGSDELRTSPSHTPPPPSSDELWPHDMPHDSTTTGTVFLLLTDSESEYPASDINLPSSSSLFRLDLNLESSTVHISRPVPQPSLQAKRVKINAGLDNEVEGDTVVRAMVQSYREAARQPGTAVNWHNTAPHDLHTGNEERQAYLALSGGFQQHLTGLVKQLLLSEGLAQSWAQTVLPLAQRVVSTIRPNLRSDCDDMDIRQYVQIKKVGGGSRSDSCIIGGVVCRKNLAHRSMPPRLNNPRVLLLSCAVVYQRVEGRLMSLEPVMMQEQEYLRHTVARIAAMAPDLVLVQRNVSRLAQESLLRLGISLVLNVKPAVLERVRRVTGADIVKSIDAQVGRPQLGTCSSFYVKTFTLETGATKTLMFLEGCPSPHLGCTVLLRGAPDAELAKLKRVTSWLIYALYNWRLELSFLMDEFARPPSLDDDTFFQEEGNQWDKQPTTPLSDNNTVLGALYRSKSTDCESVQNHLKISLKNSVEKENIGLVVTERPEGKIEPTIRTSKLSVKDKSVSEERKMNVESVSDFSDPLHSYMNLDDEVFSETNNGQSLSVSEPPQANRFRKALDDTILSVSPFLKFSVPYLETENGRNCLLRRFFPEQVYWSVQLQEKQVPPRLPSTEPSNRDALLKLNGVKLRPVHPFITAKLTEPMSSEEVQTMLALYRACGGRLPLPSPGQPPLPPPVAITSPPPPPPADIDALDLANHQRLAVLFCSYSHESPNAPAFCVNPWVVQMDYYGRNDIPLGAFLERYCFRSSYLCPSDRCNTPMLKHVRRFVHAGGAVQIALREIEGAPQTNDDDDSIFMWAYCHACNQQVSQVMPMSADSWAFSFAKYLELHFHGGVYTVRGSECTHSLHQGCRQFFGHKNTVAFFQYDNISMWEISLPPPLVVTQPASRSSREAEILEEVKRWALNGYEIFSAILNQLCTLASNGEAGAMLMKQILQKEQALFKGKVEEIQMRLTSPTHSALPGKDVNIMSLWHLEDSLVSLKRSIAEAVVEWNTRLADAEAAYLSRKRDEKNKKTAQDLKSNSSALGEIIDGVLTAQVLDVEGSVVAGGVRKSLPSQPSQHSLHSASDVMDLESRDSLGDEAVFTTDSLELDENKVVHTQDTTLPLLSGGLKTSGNGETVSVSEEVHEQTAIELDMHHVEEDVDMNTVSRESFSAKQQVTDRVSVKQILSQLLPKDTPANALQCPMNPEEHHTLPLGSTVPVVVYEREPSSIIAYALSSQDYQEQLRAKRAEQPSPSPLMKRKSGSIDTKDLMTESNTSVDARKSSVLSFLRQTSSSGNISQGTTNNETSAEAGQEELTKTEAEPQKTKSSKDKPHLEVQFSDSSATFGVKVYYADEFACLRAKIFPAGEEAFVRSLSRCVQWAARGGKSGSNFAKTSDDRFILKEMSRTETHPFMESAPQYFDYMERCVSTDTPTLLGKIVGVYRVTYRSTSSNTTIRNNLLVMENLFYGRSVRHKFDLKGSLRNRLVNPHDTSGEIVLLDENLINMTCDNPLYILPHSKTVLMQAIQSDTQFLASQSVMDYSLLVGLDETNKELVVGIIDYIRTFTWDKRIETMVKKTGLLGGQGKLPTIVSPAEYRDRFITAMHRYFLPVPDSWTSLGKGLDF